MWHLGHYSAKCFTDSLWSNTESPAAKLHTLMGNNPLWVHIQAICLPAPRWDLQRRISRRCRIFQTYPLDRWEAPEYLCECCECSAWSTWCTPKQTNIYVLCETLLPNMNHFISCKRRTTSPHTYKCRHAILPSQGGQGTCFVQWNDRSDACHL